MKKVWNAESNEWDYLPDDLEIVIESPRKPDSSPQLTVEALREAINPKAPQVVKEGSSAQVRANAKWRAKDPEKHRVYMLDYMRRYRAKRA